MDKQIEEKLQQLRKLTSTSDVNEANRAKLFFVAPTLEALRDSKMSLNDVDPEINEVINEIFEKNDNNELSTRQRIMFEKLTGQ